MLTCRRSNRSQQRENSLSVCSKPGFPGSCYRTTGCQRVDTVLGRTMPLTNSGHRVPSPSSAAVEWHPKWHRLHVSSPPRCAAIFAKPVRCTFDPVSARSGTVAPVYTAGYSKPTNEVAVQSSEHHRLHGVSQYPLHTSACTKVGSRGPKSGHMKQLNFDCLSVLSFIFPVFDARP